MANKTGRGANHFDKNNWVKQQICELRDEIAIFIQNNRMYPINQDNISKTIKVTSDDLIGVSGETLEEKIVNYINSLGYVKEDIHSDLWIDYEDVNGIFTPEFTEQFT